jgi:hypothetical protein
MANLTVTEQEVEFLKAFVTILEHLKRRAIKAEREVESLRQELTALRERVEFNGLMALDSEAHHIKNGA